MNVEVKGPQGLIAWQTGCQTCQAVLDVTSSFTLVKDKDVPATLHLRSDADGHLFLLIKETKGA